MRHAEAQPQGKGADHARPLTEHGRAEARAVGAMLAACGLIPSRILASDSQRTRDTANELLAVWALPQTVPTEWRASLYLSGLDALEEVLSRIEESSGDETVLVLGHNPGFSEAASLLSGASVGLSTACAAVLVIEARSWYEALGMMRGWTVERLVRP